MNSITDGHNRLSSLGRQRLLRELATGAVVAALLGFGVTAWWSYLFPGQTSQQLLSAVVVGEVPTDAAGQTSVSWSTQTDHPEFMEQTELTVAMTPNSERGGRFWILLTGEAAQKVRYCAVGLLSPDGPANDVPARLSFDQVPEEAQRMALSLYGSRGEIPSEVAFWEPTSPPVAYDGSSSGTRQAGCRFSPLWQRNGADRLFTTPAVALLDREPGQVEPSYTQRASQQEHITVIRGPGRYLSHSATDPQPAGRNPADVDLWAVFPTGYYTVRTESQFAGIEWQPQSVSYTSAEDQALLQISLLGIGALIPIALQALWMAVAAASKIADNEERTRLIEGRANPRPTRRTRLWSWSR